MNMSRWVSLGFVSNFIIFWLCVWASVIRLCVLCSVLGSSLVVIVYSVVRVSHLGSCGPMLVVAYVAGSGCVSVQSCMVGDAVPSLFIGVGCALGLYELESWVAHVV